MTGRDAMPAVVVRVAVAAVIMLVAWALSDVLLILFFAVLLACILRGVADTVAARTGLGAGLVLGLVVLAAVLAAGGLVWWIGPRLLGESHELVQRLRDVWRSLAPKLGMPANPGTSLEAVRGRLASPVENVLGSSLDLVAGVVIILVTAIYLAASPGLYVRGVLHLFPMRLRARIGEAMAHAGTVLQRWALGQLVDMVAVGVLAGAGLWWLGVPVPFALGVLSGLLTFVPYFGAILAAVPAVLLAFTVSLNTVLWAVGVFTLCHCVEGYLIAPNVQRRLVDLPPALTVMAMTVSGALFGLLGILLGTPLAAAGLILVRMLYVEDVLDDHTVGVG